VHVVPSQDVSEQFLLGVFQEVDSKTKVKGTLTLRDFIQCYQILYYETTTTSRGAQVSAHNRRASASRTSRFLLPEGVGPAEQAECLHAVRYGHDSAAGQSVYEEYYGH
jgi:hypothetical protein